MYELVRISLMRWNLVELEDIEIRGMTALIGPIGVGKSSILDALQTVLTGNQKSRLKLNQAAGRRSNRTVKEYCLGITEETLYADSYRKRCESMIALTFRDAATGHAVSFGIVLYADDTRDQEETRLRWIAPGVDFSFREFADRTEDDELMVHSVEAMIDRVRARAGGQFESATASARGFVDRYLGAMRRRGAAPDVPSFLKRFRNAIAFDEITDPTRFIREFVLEEDPIDTASLRSNLETWDDVARQLETVQAKSREARALRSRYANFALHELNRQNAAFTLAFREGRVAGLRLARFEARLDAIAHELRGITTEKERLRIAVEAERQAQATKQSLARTQENEARQHALSAEKARALQAFGVAMKDFVRELDAVAALAGLSGLDHALPAYVRAARATAARVSEIRAKLREASRLPVPAADLARLVAEVADARRFLPQLDAMESARVGDLRALEAKRESYRRELGGLREGGAVLDRDPRALIADLLAEGIAARSLPELVDIRKGMEEWALAAERVLGAYSQAVLVAEPDLDQAFALLRRKRNALSGARLINVRRLRQSPARPPAPQAVVSIIETQDPDIRLFLDSQFGQTEMVETDAELKAHSNAIMKDCSRSQGYGLRVHETHRPPILGRIAQGRAAAMMRETLEDLERRDIPRLQAEIAGLRALRGVLERLEAVAPEGVVGIWHRMESAAGEVGALEQAMREALDPEALRYLAEADAHAAQARSLEDQRAALDAPEKDLIIERTRLIENRGAEENAREAAEGRMRAIAAEEARDPIATYRSAVGLLELAGRPVSLASHRAMLERVAARPADEKQDAVVAAEAEAARSRNALAEIEANTDPRSHLSRIHAFLRTYPDLTLKAEELGPDQILLWLIGIVERLEGNELLKHREAIERFRDEARREVKDILVSKLYDRFTRVRSSLKALNERLARHRFSGQIYLFTHKVDPEMRPLHDLARRVAREPERAAELLEGGDPALDEAVETIRQIFQRAGDTQRFEDYRQYFMFELEMTSETVTDDEVATLIEEGARSGLRFAGRLTDRVGKASGGQKQTPFYVAIAASMAAAYYPNSRGPAEGMGLVCFDEAFSKLDIAATQELIRFFGELNLQILVAAPEEKRTSFMELMDTVVNISKAHGEPLLYIESEFIGPRAREELTAANPERIGIEGYRRILEQGAAALPPAAE